MKNLLKIYLLAFCAASFTACDPAEEVIIDDPIQPVQSLGAYILNQGTYSSMIEGSLTFFDYASKSATQNLFQKANGRSLGSTPQGAVAYGSKIYLGIYGSNVIEIIDGNTYKSLKQISLADAEGQSPRSLIADDGKVYISMFNGYVSRLDTISLEIDKTVKVGPNPEIMAIKGDYLYVPNSDGMNWESGYGTTASKINLKSFKVEKTITVPLNPTQFHSNGKDLFLLSMGNYYDIPAKIYRFDDSDNYTEIAEATLMTIKDDKVYYINAPYGTTEIKYAVYDINSGVSRNMLTDQGVDSPAAIGVDPLNGSIVITSNSMDNGWASYTIDGYAKVYNYQGDFITKFDVGVGPCAIFFSKR